MKTYTKQELDVIIAKHKLWIDCKEGGEKADLRGADLRYADLRGVDLYSANLRYADLRETNFTNADLRYADICEANLRGANLSYANLYGSNLTDANLSGANLTNAEIPMFCKRGISFKNNLLIVGCKEKTAQEWEEWLLSDEEFDTPRGTQEFKQIEACIRAGIAYLNTLNN